MAQFELTIPTTIQTKYAVIVLNLGLDGNMLKCLLGPLALHSVSNCLKTHLCKIFIFLLSSITLAIEPNQCVFAKSSSMISGRITDSNGKPIPDVSVRLWLEDLGLSSSQLSDSNGYFEIEHKPCKSCALEVVPNQNKGLASALIERIPGDSTRKIIVELKNGFLVCGRVVHDGKGLNGIVLRVFASGQDNATHCRVHGGGIALTKRDGSYSFVLTPGAKTLVVVNNHYKNLVSRVDAKFTVTSDIKLQDIIMPQAN